MVISSDLYSQVIVEVKYKYQSDMSVYYCKYQYQSQITVCDVKYRYQSSKPGNWYYSTLTEASLSVLRIFVVQNMYEADFRVFVCDESYKVKVTERYLKWIWK